MRHRRPTALAALAALTALIALTASGCELLSGLGADASDTPDTPSADNGTSGGGTSGGGTSGGGTSPADRTRAEVCARWVADRALADEGEWTGSVSACDPGTVAAPGRDNALRQLNLVRWLAGQPPVRDDPNQNAEAQACALVTHATGYLTHTPDPGSACYSQAAADGAGASNISGFPGVGAVFNYMVDPGNATTFGHRRWILSNGLGSVGIGSTDQYSCLHVFGASGSGDAAWVAWPPPGVFPIEAATDSVSFLDETGWTIQSSAIDLSSATATITRDGQALPTRTDALSQYYGERDAIAIVPLGWALEAGATYEVSVSGASQPIRYTVEVTRCE